MYAVPPMPETSGITETIIGRWMKAENARENCFGEKSSGGGRGFSWIRGGESRLDEKNIEWQLKELETTPNGLYRPLPIALYQIVLYKCFISNIFNLESEKNQWLLKKH